MKSLITKYISILCGKVINKIFRAIKTLKRYIESFIYGISNCQAVISDSFHATIFSIIFNKPFISFSNKRRGKARFDTLKEIFNLNNRIIEPNEYFNINISILLEPLYINQTKLNELKIFSINYLKKNLNIIKK